MTPPNPAQLATFERDLLKYEAAGAPRFYVTVEVARWLLDREREREAEPVGRKDER